MSFSIQLGPQPDKFIKRLDSQTRERIKNKLLKLQEDPFPQEVERVESYKGEKIFRVRVGDYWISCYGIKRLIPNSPLSWVCKKLCYKFAVFGITKFSRFLWII